MTYTPLPEDLDEPAMPAEWSDVADRVLPFNREQMAEVGRIPADVFEEAHVWGPAQLAAYRLLEPLLAGSRPPMLMVTTAGDDQAAAVWRNAKGGVDLGSPAGSFTRLIFDP